VAASTENAETCSREPRSDEFEDVNLLVVWVTIQTFSKDYFRSTDKVAHLFGYLDIINFDANNNNKRSARCMSTHEHLKTREGNNTVTAETQFNYRRHQGSC